MNVHEPSAHHARKLTIRDFLESCDLGAIPFVWTSWWCKYDALPARAKVLVQRLRSITKPALRFDPQQTHVTFNNVMPMHGVMYDELVIRDFDDQPLFTVIPRSGQHATFEHAQVLNARGEVVVDGHWSDVKAYFRSAT